MDTNILPSVLFLLTVQRASFFVVKLKNRYRTRSGDVSCWVHERSSRLHPITLDTTGMIRILHQIQLINQQNTTTKLTPKKLIESKFSNVSFLQNLLGIGQDLSYTFAVLRTIFDVRTINKALSFLGSMAQPARWSAVYSSFSSSVNLVPS